MAVREADVHADGFGREEMVAVTTARARWTAVMPETEVLGGECNSTPFGRQSFFSGTKMVITLMDDRFEGPIGGELDRKMKTDGATAKDLRLYGETNYLGLMKSAITYSQGVIIGSPNAHPELVAFAKENKRNVLDYIEDRGEFFTRINKFYDTIVGASKFEN